MGNPKGTARETRWKGQGEARGFRAQRYENGAKCRDVDFTLRDGTLVLHECKDRQNLNGHKVLATMLATYPGHLCALLWHRVSKPPGAKRSHPDGPTSVLIPADTWLDVLEVLEAAGLHADRPNRDATFEGLVDAVAGFRSRYPESVL